MHQRRVVWVHLGDAVVGSDWLHDLLYFSDDFASEAMKEGSTVLVVESECEREGVEASIEKIEPASRRRDFVVRVEA